MTRSVRITRRAAQRAGLVPRRATTPPTSPELEAAAADTQRGDDVPEDWPRARAGETLSTHQLEHPIAAPCCGRRTRQLVTPVCDTRVRDTVCCACYREGPQRGSSKPKEGVK